MSAGWPTSFSTSGRSALAEERVLKAIVRIRNVENAEVTTCRTYERLIQLSLWFE